MYVGRSRRSISVTVLLYLALAVLVGLARVVCAGRGPCPAPGARRAARRGAYECTGAPSQGAPGSGLSRKLSRVCSPGCACGPTVFPRRGAPPKDFHAPPFRAKLLS